KSPIGEIKGAINIKIANRYQALQDTMPQIWQPRGGRNGGGAWIPKSRGNAGQNIVSGVNKIGKNEISGQKFINGRSANNQYKNKHVSGIPPKNANNVEVNVSPKNGNSVKQTTGARKRQAARTKIGEGNNKIIVLRNTERKAKYYERDETGEIFREVIKVPQVNDDGSRTTPRNRRKTTINKRNGLEKMLPATGLRIF
ncbi:unnamed protein product, partial [Rotaria magnacalcarata]